MTGVSTALVKDAASVVLHSLHCDQKAAPNGDSGIKLIARVVGCISSISCSRDASLETAHVQSKFLLIRCSLT